MFDNVINKNQKEQRKKPDKLDIKRREPGILYYLFTHTLTLQTSDYDVIFDFLC